MANPDSKLNEFLSTQFPEFEHIPFRDEWHTQLMLHLELGLKEKIVKWIHELKPDTSKKSSKNSDCYREEGNRLFRSNKKLNAFEASRCYTNAILAAPDGSRALSLAHANRSAAIAELGYFKEAYEDCQCAIDYGYPDENLQKIIIRQAYCANKSKDYNKLLGCLEKLRTMTLSVQFAKNKDGFEEDLTKLKEKTSLKKIPKLKENYMAQNILKHPQFGRYMTASKNIAKGEEVLIEKAFSFVPVDDVKICSNCAAQNFIPFPCNNCARVFYCSLKCKKAQEMIHRFECYAHRCEFLTAIGITNLAMNTLLNGLPSIVPSLQNCTSPLEIWHTIDDIGKSEDKGYAEVLSLLTNLKFMQPNEIRSYSLAAAVVTYYLLEFTAFFTLFDGCTCPTYEWVVIVSALILRHTTQMMANAHSSATLVCLDNSYNFLAFSDIWAKPYHLKKGELHKFSRVYVNYAAIFPYLSMCNHSCVPSFRSKFEGDRVIATACARLKQGAEIYNTYMGDYRSNPKSERQKELKSVFHFECNCKLCSAESDDAEFLKFYKYRCQSSRCEAIFTLPSVNLRWWEHGPETLQFITCPVCETKLNLDWYWHFERLSSDPTEIIKVLQIMNFSGRILVDFSELRHRMALTAISLFFASWKIGVPLSDVEFKEIGEVLSYLLDVIEQQNNVESLVYVSKSTFALDLMAHRKCLSFDCEKIRLSFDTLSVELRTVFDNYIDDYIGDQFSDVGLG